ncbi:MAG TPA: FecR domain-containing protein [Acidobacteriaceae bacterium]|jgi:hypothetical protein
MSINCRHFLPILVLFGIFPAIPLTHAVAQTAVPPDEDFTSVYPQVVRLSYVEGDVRVSRGALADKTQSKEGEKATGWEQAASNLAIESGYSLVTGNGRAEIEFEDASTVYLADNSVLSFTELTSTGGVPYTQIALIAGSATLNVRNAVRGESFRLTTPTDTIRLNYPLKALWRVDSYLDAVSITPLKDLTAHEPGMPAAKPQIVGHTETFRHSHLVTTPVLMDKAKASDWDTWVANRMEARDEAMSATMKEAGLEAPIPGLEQLNGQGKFFACAPYGTCWEPSKGWDGKATNIASTEVNPQTTGQTAQASATPPAANAPKAKKTAQTATNAYLAGHPGAYLWTEDYYFPCSTYGTRDLYGRDPLTGREELIWSAFALGAGPFSSYPAMNLAFPGGYRAGFRGWGFSPFYGFDAYNDYYPWEWAVCHSGSWIRWHHHYAWVAGTNRHHVPPVHWVQSQRTLGFVPIHPWDKAGKQPVNLKDGIFQTTHKGESVHRIAVDDGKPWKLLVDPPKEFRKPVLEPLKVAEIPKAEAHSALNFNRAVAVGGASLAVGSAARVPANSAGGVRGTALVGSAAAPERNALAKSPGTPITFDRHSQSFSVERPVIQGGRSTMVAEPIGGRGGNYQGGGNNNSFGGRNSNQGGNPGGARPGSNAPSYGGSSANGGSRPSAPSYNGGGGSRSYSPPPSNGGSGGSFSRPSAAPSSPPPAPAPSAPSFSGGGGSAPSGGTAPHK